MQDPSLTTGSQRAPMRVAIIGAGVAGLTTAIKLRDQGISDITIFEKASEVGGTWRENRYPGVACDVPSHHYAFTFEPNPDWKHRLAHGPEIQDYMVHVSEKYDVRRDIRFNEEVVEARFDGERWHVKTRAGTEGTFDTIVACCGYLHVPRYPDIPGLDSFQGDSFHSARWPENHDFSGKRVALLGNGSTGVQIASVMGEDDVDLTIFQRSPQWVFPLPNRNIGPGERKLNRLFPVLAKLSSDFYQWFFEKVFAVAVIRSGWQRAYLSFMCRINLKRIKDRKLRAKLTPDYKPLCRRMVMSWDFYRAVQRPNVTLISDKIAAIVPEGIVTEGGVLHPFDVLLFATGFHAQNYIRPIELITERGARLTEEWAEQPTALLGIHIAKFPNFFVVGGPSSPLGNFSATAFSEAIIDRIIACILLIRDAGVARMEVKKQAVSDYYAWLAANMPGTIWVSGCSSWYLGKGGFPANNFPKTPNEFREMLRDLDLSQFDIEYRASGDIRGVATREPADA